MSLDLKIVKNYSQALYSGAKKSKVEDKVLEQITVLGQVVSNSSRVMQALCSPIVDSQIKKKILDLVASKLKFEKTTINFLHILVKNSRFSLILEIIENFWHACYSIYANFATSCLLDSFCSEIINIYSIFFNACLSKTVTSI